MGRLVNGQWHSDWYDQWGGKGAQPKGEYIRETSQLRNWVTIDGSPGPSGKGGFPAVSGRYHLYASYACPWAHRTILFRQLKNLSEHITMSVVHPNMLQHGWEFIPTDPNFRDPINYCRALYEVYLLSDPFYSGKVTVPVLWDKVQHCIVSNESSEIIRMFNSAFSALTANTPDYYPEPLRDEIEVINQFVYDTINNGVYRCGFATLQAAYDKAFDVLFDALKTLNTRLENQRYLVNNSLTEADWRLFVTLIRFDVVYYSHFKCNLCRIADFPHLTRYLKHLYHLPGVARTVSFEQIKQHFYYSQKTINPTQIVPKGPRIDL